MHEAFDRPRVSRGADLTVDTVQLELGGELDINVADELREVVSELILTPARYAVVDMTRVAFLDSTALSHLLRLGRSYAARGGVVSLVAPRPQVMRVLELMALTGVFAIVPTTQDALQAVRPAA